MDIQTVQLLESSLAQLWDYGDPALSGDRFNGFAMRAIEEGLEELAAIAQTQRARSLGLYRKFEEGFALIELISAQNPSANGALAVRLGLERGRLLNSSGKRDESASLFIKAWTEACSSGLDGLAVDAAHMLGIVLDGQSGMVWNERALQLAIDSKQPEANRWKGSLFNNIGWSYHNSGDYERAIKLFEQALEWRVERGTPEQIRVSKWCVGRCYRSLGQVDRALAVQRVLEKDPAADSYVLEELGECLVAQNKVDDAKPYFAKAYKMLSQASWLAPDEQTRLERLKELSV